MSSKKYERFSDDYLESNLSSMEYAVTQQNATEKPFTHEYDQLDDLGIYVLNYKKILSFLDTKIIITDNIKNVSIIGNKLVISKLKKEELYITGDIYEVVLR